MLERGGQRGGTIFLTSHILAIVEKLCTHVAIIHQGRLISQGTLEAVSRGRTLEEVFVDAVGHGDAAGAGLSWMGGRSQ